jgi:hypothetical protein
LFKRLCASPLVRVEPLTGCIFSSATSAVYSELPGDGIFGHRVYLHLCVPSSTITL